MTDREVKSTAIPSSRAANIDLAADVVVESDRACAAGDDTTRVPGDESDHASRNDPECREPVDSGERLRCNVGDRCRRPDRQFGDAPDERFDVRGVDAATISSWNGLAVRTGRRMPE